MDDDEARPIPNPPAPWWEVPGTDVWGRVVGDRSCFAEAWGRRPLLSTVDGDVTAIFDLPRAESLLATGLRRPAFRLVQDGATLADTAGARPLRLGGRHLDDVADPERIASSFVDGATIVFQGLHRTDPTVASFATTLARASGHGVQVNAYLSPAGARGLRPHRDGHDVLAIQVRGSKRWQVEGLGELTLEPGRVAYIPAGVEHAAATSADSSSLHLTLGLMVVTRRHVVNDVLAAMGELDAPLPPWFATADRAQLVDEVGEAVRIAVERLTGADPNAVAQQQIERSRRRPGVPPGGWLRSLAGIESIDDTSVLMLRDECVALEPVSDDAPRVGLRRGQRSLRMPPVAGPALAALLERRRVPVGELPGLDGPSRLVLARRLVRERFALLGDLGSTDPVPPTD